MADRSSAPPPDGERDLTRLLGGLAPRLDDRSWVFAILPPGAVPSADAFAIVREAEGLTAIVPAGGDDGPRQARITLAVHSSLEAVGLTAAVSGALAREGIPANMVAGYFHDHLFVPEDRAVAALACLRRLADDYTGAAR